MLNNKAHRAGWSATREVSHWHLSAAKWEVSRRTVIRQTEKIVEVE